MNDPLDVLRDPGGPAEPDPQFAAQLKARIERALMLPKGVTVSDLSLEPSTPEPTPTGTPAPTSAAGDPGFRHGDIGYASLWVPSAERAATFFADVLGWQYREPVGGNRRQVVGQALHHGIQGGTDQPTLFVCLAAADLDATLEEIRAAGGEADPPTDEVFGRVAMCRDDQGVSFATFQPPGGAVAAERGGSGAAAGSAAGGHQRSSSTRAGDLVYVTYEVVDSGRARRFYGRVFGWQFEGGRVSDGWQILNGSPSGGISGGHAAARTSPSYQVDDITAAVERVRRRGGQAGDPVLRAYGWASYCTDDQGTRFMVFQEA